MMAKQPAVKFLLSSLGAKPTSILPSFRPVTPAITAYHILALWYTYKLRVSHTTDLCAKDIEI